MHVKFGNMLDGALQYKPKLFAHAYCMCNVKICTKEAWLVSQYSTYRFANTSAAMDNTASKSKNNLHLLGSSLQSTVLDGFILVCKEDSNLAKTCLQVKPKAR